MQARIDRKQKMRIRAQEESRKKVECLLRSSEVPEDGEFWMEDIANIDFGLERTGVASPFSWVFDEAGPSDPL